MNPGWALYRAVTRAAGGIAPLAAGFLPAPESALWHERLGRAALESCCDAWIHAASLGEAVAARGLVEALERRHPGGRFHFTATTRTGRSRLEALGTASLAPLDTPQAADRCMAGLRPRRLFLLETELWPRWLEAARRHGIPVAVVSARLSARTAGRLRLFGAPLRNLVGGLAAVLCQTEEDRGRWTALGADPERTAVTGNLKLDALPSAAPSRAAARAELGLERDRPLLVLGSLRPGEVAVLAGAWSRIDRARRLRWQVVAVPRHPAAERALRQEALTAGVVLRGCEGADAGAWTWDARPGVLAAYYACADAAFVGGSLGPFGGHNPLEPAACGLPVLMGPHHGAQAAAVNALAGAGGLRICAGGQELADALGALIDDDAQRSRMGEAARIVVEGLRGVGDRTVDRLVSAGLWPAG